MTTPNASWRRRPGDAEENQEPVTIHQEEPRPNRWVFIAGNCLLIVVIVVGVLCCLYEAGCFDKAVR